MPLVFGDYANGPQDEVIGMVSVSDASSDILVFLQMDMENVLLWKITVLPIEEVKGEDHFNYGENR